MQLPPLGAKPDATACQGCQTTTPAGTAAIGAFTANRFGLHDVHGNAAEWVRDCAEPKGVDVATGCKRRLVKGGHWASPAAGLTLDATVKTFPDLRNNRIGFRILRGSRSTANPYNKLIPRWVQKKNLEISVACSPPPRL